MEKQDAIVTLEESNMLLPWGEKMQKMPCGNIVLLRTMDMEYKQTFLRSKQMAFAQIYTFTLDPGPKFTKNSTPRWKVRLLSARPRASLFCHWWWSLWVAGTSELSSKWRSWPVLLRETLAWQGWRWHLEKGNHPPLNPTHEGERGPAVWEDPLLPKCIPWGWDSLT